MKFWLRIKLASFIFFVLVSQISFSHQTKIGNYDSARDTYFWKKLYTEGGTGIYCETIFNNTGHYVDYKGVSKRMTLEHAYPADWIATYHGCENRNSCEIKEYGFAEADLHNLWPARGDVNSSRSDHLFGEIDDDNDNNENRYVDKNCADFERLYNVSDDEIRIEPQDISKGELARSILYMHDTYNLPLHGMKEMLIRWHESDSMSNLEKKRNTAIYNIQGTKNHWIGN